MDRQNIRKWSKKVGGLPRATRLVFETLECSLSKAEKLVAGRYHMGFSPAEQKALCKLTNMSVDQLFPVAAEEESHAAL